MYKTLHKKQGSVTVQLRFARSSVTFCAKRDNRGACQAAGRKIMRMFRIKMTAARTNPQQIREVRIDSEKTVGELLELVRIVYEYGDVRGSLLNEAGASQSPETKLKDRIHVRDLLTVNYTDKSITPIYLEVLEEFDGSGETAPILERYRTIPRRTRKTAFGYPAFAPEEAERFQKYLNKEISKVFAPELVVPDFAWEIATPWQSLLDSGTAADLKILIKENKLPVNVYLRKAELEKGIIKEAGKSDFWENIMQTMGITEYFQVKELCIQGSKFVNGDAVDTTFPVLSRNRLVDENYWYRTILAKEFMEFFENWLGSGKEREYIKDHAEQTCFLAACRLYGFADRELVTEFYKIMCPEQNAAERVGTFWKQAMQCALQYNIKKIVGMEVYYDSQSVSSNSVKLLYRSFLTSDRFHYVPTKAEIEDIAISGIGFSEKDREALIDMMERKYRCERTNGRFIVGELEKAIHTGIPAGELTGYLQKALLSGRRSSYLGDIMEILERAQRTVRKIPLGGYTETEINRAVTKKKVVRVEKKIYPNDPCPCGSGKKYKNCCGRR